MITGTVRDDEGRIRLRIVGTGRYEREIEAVIDTGYTGSLTLPPEAIAALDLRWRSLDRGILADGSECLFDVYEAVVEWDGAERVILVDEADADPLIGMRLLRGYELLMQVRDSGDISISPLS